MGDCRRTGENPEPGHRDSGLVDAGHERTAGGTEDLHDCPKNSYGPVHHARHRASCGGCATWRHQGSSFKVGRTSDTDGLRRELCSEARPPEGMIVGRDPSSPQYFIRQIAGKNWVPPDQVRAAARQPPLKGCGSTVEDYLAGDLALVSSAQTNFKHWACSLRLCNCGLQSVFAGQIQPSTAPTCSGQSQFSRGEKVPSGLGECGTKAESGMASSDLFHGRIGSYSGSDLRCSLRRILPTKSIGFPLKKGGNTGFDYRVCEPRRTDQKPTGTHRNFNLTSEYTYTIRIVAVQLKFL